MYYAFRDNDDRRTENKQPELWLKPDKSYAICMKAYCWQRVWRKQHSQNPTENKQKPQV